MLHQFQVIKYSVLITVVFLVILSSASNAEAEKPKTIKPQILTTTNIVEDLVKNIMGDLAEVDSLMGAGVDPHSYKPSFKDVSKIRKAKIIVLNGLTLEGKLEPILLKFKKKDKKVIAVADFSRKDLLLSAEKYENAYDPHIWFDPNLWSLAAVKASSELSNIFPEHVAEITTNTANYLNEISKIDTWAKNEISSIPENQRVLVTAHDAFRYFGKRYGLQVKGLQGISTASDYGLRDVKNLSELIVSSKVPAIFLESSVPEKFIKSLQKAVLAKNYQVKIGGTLYSDALGPKDSAAGTYLGMLKENTQTIVSGLKGSKRVE